MTAAPSDVQRALDAAVGPLPPAAGPDRRALDEALRDALSGGKRFRPRLVAAVHDALGGTARTAVAEVGAAVELLHTAFLVHDDVIDGDDLRRGRPSTPGRFRAEALGHGATPQGAESYARAASVLVGDLALSHALRAVALCEVDAGTRASLLDLFDTALRVSATGELADVRLSLGVAEPTLAEVLAMEAHKTAAYSFELPMQAGAALAGAESGVVDGVGRVGRLLGVAYQLLDDLEGVFGDPEGTGKAPLGDLREGKRTPLIVHAQGSATWGRVSPYLGRADLGPADAARVRNALEEGGSRAFVEELARRHLREAAEESGLLGLPPDLVHDVGAVSSDRPAGAA
ncbi:polyprenyl synthetase family protein [Nocardioides sp. cx-169]|uniref:polyprenyl synthetase family protein n=1 Tax=Nocardioides sp. cx-169 TaxID=2899080 RepID=UPI001E33279C|nr:polyprenyl synthetase family protein [Nocardioides sp. cx-169]MCD4536455.1 polyprenyl synthetase family protein [Nocardioides sp. cx-169]